MYATYGMYRFQASLKNLSLHHNPSVSHVLLDFALVKKPSGMLRLKHRSYPKTIQQVRGPMDKYSAKKEAAKN